MTFRFLHALPPTNLECSDFFGLNTYTTTNFKQSNQWFNVYLPNTWYLAIVHEPVPVFNTHISLRHSTALHSPFSSLPANLNYLFSVKMTSDHFLLSLNQKVIIYYRPTGLLILDFLSLKYEVNVWWSMMNV